MELEPVARSIAAHVRRLRRERGWSAAQLAMACATAGYPGLTRSTIAKIESGVRKTVTAAEVAGLAKALDITPTQLLSSDLAPDSDARALTLWPADERQRLFELLASGTWVRLAADYQASAGPYAGDPGLRGADARAYFQELEQLNSSPGGVPPSLLFLERLAAQVEPGLAEELRAWVRRQATRLGVPVPVVGEPVGAAIREDAHLVIRLERDAMDEDRYEMRPWTQLGSDAPRAGEEFVGSLHLIQQHVVELVADAEADWATDAGIIRLEFVLPRELLNLPIDQWPGHVEGEPPQPLGLRHQIVVRSLDRMRTKHWHRPWRKRWEDLWTRSWRTPGSLVWADARDPVELRRLDATLATHDQVVMALAHRPPERPAAWGDEVTIGLRAGMPVMLWLREDRFADGFETVVDTLLDAGGDLPESARLLRSKAFSADRPETHVGSHVTLLWDDPNRLIELSGPIAARR